MTEDAPEYVQDLMVETTDRLEAAGLEPVRAAHTLVKAGLVRLETLACAEHLVDELDIILEAVTDLRSRILGGLN